MEERWVERADLLDFVARVRKIGWWCMGVGLRWTDGGNAGGTEWWDVRHVVKRASGMKIAHRSSML